MNDIELIRAALMKMKGGGVFPINGTTAEAAVAALDRIEGRVLPELPEYFQYKEISFGNERGTLIPEIGEHGAGLTPRAAVLEALEAFAAMSKIGE